MSQIEGYKKLRVDTQVAEYYKNTKTYYLKEYNSLFDFIDDCKIMGDYNGTRSSRSYSGGSFNATKSYEEMEELAYNGWDSGIERLSKLRDKITSNLKPKPPVLVRDVVGQVIDIEAYVHGEPECMIEYVTPLEKKLVHLVVNMTASAGVGVDAYIARGSMIASICDLLERSDVGVKISIGFASGGYEEVASAYLNIKNYNQRFDINKFSLCVAHPGMLRRFFLSYMENMPREIRESTGVGHGYGYPSPMPNEYRGDLYISDMHLKRSYVNSPTAAINYVKEVCKEYGIEFL